MAFTSGTATDYLDLLDQLRSYLTAQGWTELAFTAASGGTAMQPAVNARLTTKGPGAGAGKEVFVDLLTGWNATIGSYCWRMRAMTDYEAGAAWGLMPNSSPEVYLNLWQNTMDYWFYVNDRRIVVVAKIGTNYVSLYGGFFLPFALPSEYPMPLFIASSYNQQALPAVDNSANRMIADPGLGCAYYMARQTLAWWTVANHLNNDNVNSAPANGHGYAFVWPHGTSRGDSQAGNGDWDQGGFLWQRPNVNGEMALFQSHIIDPDKHVVVGALDGVYSTGGQNRVPEQTVTFSGRTFDLFNNVFRTAAGDFFAVEES